MTPAEDRVEDEIARLREIAERRVRGSGGPTSEASSAVEEAAQLATLTSWGRVTSSRTLVGPVIVLFKRLARRVLGWFFQPIAARQSAFNEAVVRALYQLRTENDALRRQLQAQVDGSDERP